MAMRQTAIEYGSICVLFFTMSSVSGEPLSGRLLHSRIDGKISAPRLEIQTVKDDVEADVVVLLPSTKRGATKKQDKDVQRKRDREHKRKRVVAGQD